MTKLEFLPNEVLLLCFQYFGTIELFDIFDGVNHRFSQLIRQMPVHLNFELVSKSIFEQFCTLLSLNDQFKNQVYSLKLSNKNISKQIDIFFSKFSLDQFLHLKSLTVNETIDKNIRELNSVLPRMSALCVLNVPNPKSDIPLTTNVPKLKVLSTLYSPQLAEKSSITHLSIGTWSSRSGLENIFRCLPLLKYFRLNLIGKIRNETNDKNCVKAVHLKHFIVEYLVMFTFEKLEHVFRHTPNLTNLTICRGQIDYIDARQMQQTIESFLPLLRVFKFTIFPDRNNCYVGAINQIYKQFQTNFWLRQHQWLTSCDRTSIYTIQRPSSDDDSLMSYDCASMNRSNTFENVRCLTIDPRKILDNHQYFFPKIETLLLENHDKDERISINIDVQQLKSVVNFAYVKHLYIQGKFTFENSSDLFKLFQQMPKLYKLTTNQAVLALVLECSQLCKHLPCRIRTLNIFLPESEASVIFNHEKRLSKFHDIFNDIEIFTGPLDSIEQLIYLMNHFTKLSVIYTLIISSHLLENEIKQLKMLLFQRNAIYDIDQHQFRGDNYTTTIHVWI